MSSNGKVKYLELEVLEPISLHGWRMPKSRDEKVTVHLNWTNRLSVVAFNDSYAASGLS
jgi:hypothetical protein